MRIAYLECFSGISGDMFLGALLDAGVSAKLLEETVAELNLGLGVRLEVSKVLRSGISATKVDVWASDKQKDAPRDAESGLHQEAQAGMPVPHSHEHSHEHGHHHAHEPEHQPKHRHG